MRVPLHQDAGLAGAVEQGVLGAQGRRVLGHGVGEVVGNARSGDQSRSPAQDVAKHMFDPGGGFGRVVSVQGGGPLSSGAADLGVHGRQAGGKGLLEDGDGEELSGRFDQGQPVGVLGADPGGCGAA